MADHSHTIIEVFADVGCPFTHVGIHRFVDYRRSIGRDDVVLWVKAWPLELVNGHPLDPRFISEEVDEIREHAAPDLFAMFQTSTFPASSMPSLTLAAAGYEASLEIGERVSLALRSLLFEQGQDISNDEVLTRLAGQHGLEVRPEHEALVQAEHEEGKRRGVVGSPHFFTPGGGFFCPSLDVGRDARGHLRVHADPAGFDAFLASCFD